MEGVVMTHVSTFEEATAEVRVQSVPLAHLSVELGHLYFEDFEEGADRVHRHFAEVAPWVAAVKRINAPAGARTLRLSTCFLIDDYFGPSRPPSEIIPMLVKAAADNDIPIDYLARESACAVADGVALASLVLDRVVADPPPGTDGSRPPVSEVGWLSNGQRSPALDGAEAMSVAGRWTPPSQNAATRHSVFVDVQLWDEHERQRRWSCAFLAAVWQLLRLGMIRKAGEPVAMPRPLDGDLPDDWRRLPAVIQLNSSAAPFNAYRALSVLGSRFFPTEQAVRTILNQVAVDPRLVAESVRRAGGEKIQLPGDLIDRIQYVFIG
jgi:hypothetical protein